MQIKSSQEGRVTVLTLTGRIDSTTAAELERTCDERITAGGVRLLLELGGIQYVSSAGLRVFLVVAKRLEKLGGRLVLCSLPTLVQEVLAIAGFDRILKIAPDRAAGVALLEAP